MHRNLTYSYLVAWIIGGLMLVVVLLLRTERRPYSAAFASIAFGAAGFLSLGFNLADWMQVFWYAVGAGVVGGALGYAMQPRSSLQVQPPQPPIELP